MIMELCDPDNRLSDLYAMNCDRNELTYMSDAYTGMAQFCATELANKFLK